MCFAWGREFRHCCVAVPKSRGLAADFLCLVYVLWGRRGVGGGPRTLVPQAGVRVCVWALGALPPPSVVTLLRGASEVERSPPSGCPPPGGCRGPMPMCSGQGCAGMGPSTVPVARMPCEGCLVSGAVPPPAARPQGRAVGVPRPVCPGWGWCGRGGPARAHSVRPRGPALRAVWVAQGRPRGGALHRHQGRLRSGAFPPPTARPPAGLSGSATHVL